MGEGGGRGERGGERGEIALSFAKLDASESRACWCPGLDRVVSFVSAQVCWAAGMGIERGEGREGGHASATADHAKKV